jgi:hypothetical protein
MRRTIRRSLVLVIGVALLGTGAAEAQKKTQQTTPLTAEFHDGEVYGLRSDGGGLYHRDAAAGEGPFINRDGGLSFDLKTNVGMLERSFSLDFSKEKFVFAGTTCPVPYSSVTATAAGLQLAVRDGRGNVIPLENLIVGDSYTGGGYLTLSDWVRYSDGEYSWNVRWDTDEVDVRRISRDEWLVSSGALVKLQCVKRTRGSMVWQNRGMYDMPFSLTLKKQ